MAKMIDEKDSTGYIKEYKKSPQKSKHIIVTIDKISNGLAKIASPTDKNLYLYLYWSKIQVCIKINLN